MNDSVVLMSSMSPKIINKLNPGERQFRKVAGASILALKRNIRRSSIYDKSIMTTKNENLNIVESNSSISTESFPSLQLKESQDNSVVIIPDSNCSSDSSHSEDNFKFDSNLNEFEDTRVKTEASCLLPKDKLAAISHWVANVNTVNTGNNTISSVYSDLSTICGTDFGKDFLPKKEGHAINSTFVNGHDQGFDQMFGRQNNLKVADESVSSSSDNVVNESLKNIIIEDSFEILNQSLRTRLKISENNDKLEIITDSKLNDNSHIESPKDSVSNKWTSIQFSEESSSIIRDDGIHESFKQTVIDRPIKNKVEVFETPKNSSKWKAVEISDDSGEDETVAENMLDELYGNSWRINKDLILSKTEPRKRAKKPSIKTVPNSESKPKFSLLYKNPYLDNEKSKSQKLLESLHKSKLKEISKSPWHERLKDLCDSNTPSENSPNMKNVHKKLYFDESSLDEEDIESGTKSKYFKNVNVRNRKRNKLSISSQSSDKSSGSRNINVNCKTGVNVLKISKNSTRTFETISLTDSDDEFTVNKKLEISKKTKLKTRKKSYKNTISNSNFSGSESYNDLKVATNKKTDKQPMPSSDKNQTKKEPKHKTGKLMITSGKNKIIANAGNSSSSSCDIKVKTNKNPSKTTSSSTFSTRSNSSSDSYKDLKIATNKKTDKPMPSSNKNQTKKEPKHKTDKLMITSGKSCDLKVKTNRNPSKTTSSSTFSNSNISGSDSYKNPIKTKSSNTFSNSSISGNDSYNDLKVTTNKKTDKQAMPSSNKNQTKKEPKHKTDKLITSGKNKIIANTGNSSSSSDDLKLKTNKNIVKTTSSSTKNKIIASTSNSSGSSSDLKVKTNKNPSKKTSSANNKNKIIASSSSESDLKIITKKKIEIKITTKPTPSRTSISSDEEWEEQVSRIERRLTIADDGTYSFLASLSASVPIIKCDMSARIFRNNYKTYKDQLLKKLFKMYNEEVFDNALSQDMPIEWSDKMRKTAGCCFCKKITKRTGQIERTARIVLSTKVLDAADRMRDTLIHEMCHAATWIVNCIADGHGDYWKSWAFKAMKKFPELPQINRCHNYVINTKYTYKCTGCGYSIGRHSKSLDIERKRCGYCLGKFEVLVNKTNKKGETKAVAATPKKEATGFALYVKENYGIYKNPLRKHADVMKVLGQKFKEMQVNKL